MLISNVWCFLYQFFSGENKVKITPKVNNAHTLLYVLLKSRCLPTCQKKERASKVGKRTMGTMPIKPLYNSKFSWLFRGEVCVHRNASKTSTFSLTCCWQAGTKSSDCNKFTEILFFCRSQTKDCVFCNPNRVRYTSYILYFLSTLRIKKLLIQCHKLTQE